jgi:quercetin dioxygenase-like cupin family protein
MKTIVRAGGEGEQRWFFGGGVHTWKVSAEDTEGGVSVFEDSLERGKTTPLHTHPEHDETVVVLEGEILVHADGKPHIVGAGGVVVTPRGVPHAFMVMSERARVVAIATPGTVAEAFYRHASTDAVEGPVDFGKVGAAAKATGATVILGPSPFAKL